MRKAFSTVVAAVALVAVLAVIAYSQLRSGGAGGWPNGETLDWPAGPTPDLTGYKPPPGCILDRIYEKDGYVWSEFLNVAIRPVVETTDEGKLIAFPVQAYPDVLNCHDSAQTVNPYVPPTNTPKCAADEIRARDGWVVSQCFGRLRPDIPMIVGGGDQVILSGPLGETGIIISDYFTDQ